MTLGRTVFCRCRRCGVRGWNVIGPYVAFDGKKNYRVGSAGLGEGIGGEVEKARTRFLEGLVIVNKM